MENKPVYDYTLVDSIRVLEQQYQAQLEQAKESVKRLANSVNALRNQRLHLEMVESE
jgi:phosphoenolpyruvate carboxylase